MRKSYNVLQLAKRRFAFDNLSLPATAKIIEVGPRDGLQNEKLFVPTPVKVEFINKLSATGLSVVEATSFVSPKWVFQMKDHTEVFTSIEKKENVNYPVLVPNMKGLEQALGLGVKEVAIFIAASNSFSRRNINCTIEESLQRYDEVIAHAIQSKVKVRGYISTVVGCPYEGPVAPDVVAKLSLHLFNKGCYEISLGDTIGVGTPSTMTKMLRAVQKVVPTSALAVHCHNTYGQALSNIYASLLVGVNNIDSSVAGLGGCPFAPGATGNVPTEDVVYMLNGLGVKTNLNLDMLIETGQYMCNFLGKRNASNVAVALLAKKQQQEQQQQQQASVQQQTSAKTSNNNNTICV